VNILLKLPLKYSELIVLSFNGQKHHLYIIYIYATFIQKLTDSW